MQMTNADVVEIARVSVGSAQAHARGNEVLLRFVASSNAIEIDGDAVRLAQAVDNLISNAVKFNPAGGKVDVTVTQGEGRVTLFAISLPVAHALGARDIASPGRTRHGLG
jgi:signal transduction histidine kinase